MPAPYPMFSEELTYAGELAAVIDEECNHVAESVVDDVVRGYAILDDLAYLDQQGRTARKAFDASGPPGPVVATDVDRAGADLLVLGHHGRTGRERRRSLGSTTERILEGADRPLLVVDIGDESG